MGQSLVEVPLRNALMPVLLELVGEGDATLDLAVLAFRRSSVAAFLPPSFRA